MAQALYDLCQKYGWILYNDEVQEGVGRTGKWFAIEHWPGVEAELLSLGKGISGGLMPLACTLGSDRMSEPAGELYTGGTFAGNPAACLVAVKLLEIMERDKVLDNVAELEKVAKARFGAMKDKYEIVGDVRVIGAYMCVEFVEDKDTQDAGARPHARDRLRHGAQGRRAHLRAGVQLLPPHAGAQPAARAVRAGLRHRGGMRRRGQQGARQGRAVGGGAGHDMTYEDMPYAGIATFFKAPLVPEPTRTRPTWPCSACPGTGHHQPVRRAHGAARPARGLDHVGLPRRPRAASTTARPASSCWAACAGPTAATCALGPMWSADRYHEAVVERCSRIVEAGVFPVTLGGDHSIAYPVLKALYQARDGEPFQLVQFDTHMDYWDEEGGSRYSHASPIIRCHEAGWLSGLTQYGIRSLHTAGDNIALAQRRGARIFWCEQAKDMRVEELVEHLPGRRRVHHLRHRRPRPGDRAGHRHARARRLQLLRGQGDPAGRRARAAT